MAAGEGFRAVARLARVDRKTVRGYVAAAQACGLDQAGGEGQLGDELLGAVAERVRPHRADGPGESWALLAAHHARLEELLEAGLTVVKAGELLARDGVVAPMLLADDTVIAALRDVTALDRVKRESSRIYRWGETSRGGGCLCG